MASVSVTPTTEPVTVTPITASVSVTPTTEPATVGLTTEPVTVPAATEAVLVTPTTEPVSIPVSIPKTKEKVPTATTESAAVPVKVQQLLDMGFALPVETLTNILAASNDDVSTALSALLGSF